MPIDNPKNYKIVISKDALLDIRAGSIRQVHKEFGDGGKSRKE